MAIQAHMYQQNLGLLSNSSQDYFFMANNNNNNNNNLLYNEYGYNNLQHKLLQEQQFQYQQQYLQRRNSFMKQEDSFVFVQPSKRQKLATTTSTTTSDSDNHIIAQVEKQRNEIDRYITLQNEWLKLALQEQRKQQLGVIIKKLEAKAIELLKQKDDQIMVAKNKTIELQEIVRKLEVENQAWKKVALENEEMVLSLNNSLEQIKQQQQQQQECSSSSSNNGVEDCESCYKVCDNDNTKEYCKVCNSRKASVLLLPCRHLCCCKDCDAFVNACPVCKSPKMASIHALIS